MKGKMTAEEYRADVCRIISEMLDNPDNCGIYPTTKCFNDLLELIQQALTQHKQTIAEYKKLEKSLLDMMIKYMPRFDKQDGIKFESNVYSDLNKLLFGKGKQYFEKMSETISKQAEEIAELKDDYNQLSIMDRGHRDKISKQAEEIERLKKVLNWHSAESE